MHYHNHRRYRDGKRPRPTTFILVRLNLTEHLHLVIKTWLRRPMEKIYRTPLSVNYFGGLVLQRSIKLTPSYSK